MGSAAVRAGQAVVGACLALGTIGAEAAHATAVPIPACPGSQFNYTGVFRFPPAPEGFAPDCAVRVGVLSIEADAGRADFNVAVGSAVTVDDRGRLSHFPAPAGPEFDVGSRGGPIASVRDSTGTAVFTYGAAGRLTKVTGAKGTTTLSYNAAGQLIKLATATGSESFGYGSGGHVTSFSDTGGDTGTFTYSGGRLADFQLTLTAMDPSDSFTYGSSGALASWTETDLTSVTRKLTLTAAGDVSTVTEGTTTDAQLTYVAPHRPADVTGNGGSTLATFTYDPAGRLSTVSGASSGETSFTYGSSGRLSGVTYATGPSTTETSDFTYDAHGRLVKIVASGASTISIAYMPAPGAATKAAQSIGRRRATLTGTVTPRGLPTMYKFQFGRTRSYGQTTAMLSAGNGKLPRSVSVAISGLHPNTTYHYRLIAVSAAGTTYGADRTFHTKRR